MSCDRLRDLGGKSAQLALVGAAVFLTMANSMAPPVRQVTEVTEREGSVEIALDARVYVDKPLEATLPAGDYARVTLVAIASDGERTVLEVDGDDPRLRADPVRLELRPPAEAGLHDGQVEPETWELRVETADGAATRLRFVVTGVVK